MHRIRVREKESEREWKKAGTNRAENFEYDFFFFCCCLHGPHNFLPLLDCAPPSPCSLCHLQHGRFASMQRHEPSIQLILGGVRAANSLYLLKVNLSVAVILSKHTHRTHRATELHIKYTDRRYDKAAAWQKWCHGIAHTAEKTMNCNRLHHLYRASLAKDDGRPFFSFLLCLRLLLFTIRLDFPCAAASRQWGIANL